MATCGEGDEQLVGCMVDWLIRNDDWDIDKIRPVSVDDKVQLIHRTPFLRPPCWVSHFWPHKANGLFTIKSAYH